MPGSLGEEVADMSLPETSPESRDNAMQATVRLNIIEQLVPHPE